MLVVNTILALPEDPPVPSVCPRVLDSAAEALPSPCLLSHAAWQLPADPFPAALQLHAALSHAVLAVPATETEIAVRHELQLTQLEGLEELTGTGKILGMGKRVGRWGQVMLAPNLALIPYRD